MEVDVTNMIEGCSFCQDRLPSHPNEPLIVQERPERPFQEVAADFAFYGGHKFLIIIDRLTDWIEIFDMGSNTTAARIVEVVCGLFVRTAIPDIFYTDGEINFDSMEFRNFLKDFGCRHVLSSLHHARSNGKAASAVKAGKRLIAASWSGNRLDNRKFSLALMQHRNTPTTGDGLSPAQKLYGRPLQDTLPAHRRSFDPAFQSKAKDAEAKHQCYVKKTREYHDAKAASLMDLNIGAHVAIQDPETKEFSIHGTIVAEHRRRYWIRTESGRIMIRNRRFVRRRLDITAGGGGGTRINNPLPQPGGTANAPPQPSQVNNDATGPTLKRSGRESRPPRRLVDEPYWP